MPEITAQYIYGLYREYHVPQKVVDHMIKVAKFSEKLCDKFIKKGYKINKNLVIQAALLHDLVRVADFKTINLEKLNQKITSKDLEKWIELQEEYKEYGHGEAAYKILKSLNLKNVAALVRNHALKRIDDLKSWEEKILYYADKRVEGAHVVRLKTRLKKIRKRAVSAGAPLNKMLKIEKKVFRLEREISSALR